MKNIFIILNIITMLYATGFNSEDGAPIRQGVHIEWYRTVSPGNSGETIFIWSDTRFGMRNIFAHKLNSDGEFLWGESGAVVTDLPGRQEDPVSITDGNGGVFIAWVDYRFDAEGDIYFQHLDNNGNILLDENGIALCNQPGKQITINMCTDSLGGVFVTWQDKRGGIDEDIYGTHITADNEIVNPGTGAPIVVEGGHQNAKTIEYAGNNEAFIAWADFRQGANSDIYGQRINVNMTTSWAENGIQIAGTEEQELKPRTTFMAGETNFITWKEGDENSKIYYQLVDEDGLALANEVGISSVDAIQTAPRVKRSSIGEVFVNWTDLRDDPINGDQYFQKVNLDGEAQWGDGVRVDPADDTDFSARFSAGTSGDLNVIWERGTFPEVDIYYQNINSDGSFSVSDPVGINVESGYQFSPILSGNNETGLFAIYGDKGTGSIDLKVQKIGSDFQPVWESNGLTGMIGLDGDIKYSSSYRISDNDFFTIWEDNRSSKKIYGSRITNGTVSAENGIQMSFADNSSSENDLTQPEILKTDNSIFSATFDGTTSPKFIRVNKYNENLENVWPDSGVSLTAYADMRNASLIDVDGEVGVFWSESRLFNYNIYYQKLDSEGNISFESGGIELVDSNSDDYLLGIVPTPDGKFLIFWMEDAWPAAVLKYSKIDGDGNIEIGWNPNGNSLSGGSYDARNLQVKKIDDETGVFAVWTQNGNFNDIFGQVIGWDGNIAWDEGGIAICDAENDQENVSFQFNEAKNKSFLAWEDLRNGSDFEIYGQIVNLSDGALDGENIQFSVDTTDQYNPLIGHVQDNEFMIIWEDSRGYYNEDPLLINGGDLYGSGYVIGQGMTTDVNGIPICIAYHKQEQVNIIPHNGEEFFLDWIDYRSSGKEDLANYYGRTLMKAELLSNDSACDECKLPTQFSLKPAYPNPFNGAVTFEFELPAKESVEFKLYDLTGRVVADKLILPNFGGNYRIQWDGITSNGQLAPAGIYFYEFKTSSAIKTGKVTYLK